MDLFMFAICYVSFIVAILVVLLFGENPMLMGTPVAWLHWLLTQGPCAIMSWVTKRLFGAKGVKALDTAFENCCDKPNPLMQLTYLGILAAGYYMYSTHLFSFLGSNPWVPVFHMYTGTAAVGLCLLSFVWACISDPGVITQANFQAHDALYQCDDLIFSEKHCRTCEFLRPARSKHCSTCNRCVARFDHHCSWINNDVGLLNLRAFLTFLGTNCLMCIYGATLATAILGGELKKRGFYEIKLINYQTGQTMPAYHNPGRVTEFLLVYYPVATAMALFMLLTCFLMGFFLSYQLYLLSQGKTQYETFRWLDVHLTLIKLERQRLKKPVNRYKWLRVVSWMWDFNPPVQMPENLYNQGFWKNLMQVVRPHEALAAALQRHLTEQQQQSQVAAGPSLQQDAGVASGSPSSKAHKRSSKKAAS